MTVASVSARATTAAAAMPMTEEKPESDTAASVSSKDREVREGCVPVYDVSASATRRRGAGSIASFVDRMHGVERNDIDELLGRAIYATGSPLSIVERPHWQALFSKLRPSYSMPSRHTIATKLLDAEYARISCTA